ncbi:MAG TPA: divergent polysaccharide deacetylase family protein [Armatimonadota bacterium]|nr:divergent polysaccharide deacetylase family protein [Armatimonadota bacterium]
MTTPSPRRAAGPVFPWILAALFLLVIAVLWWLGRASRPPAPPPSAPRPGGVGAPATGGRRARAHARPPAVASPARPITEGPSPKPRERPLLPHDGGRVAIIVDDVGYNAAVIREFTALPYALTFSVLPGVERSRELARACSAAGFEVMLHLPMEPLNSRLDPGPGCIMVEMTDDQIAALVEDDLAAVPAAVGVNNHMGSRATADPRVMRAVLSVLRRQGLLFVDSRTTGSSVAGQVAAELGVLHAARSVFLDTNLRPEPGTAEEFLELAQERVEELGRLAQRRGCAIGICHYREQTAQMLARLLPLLREAGIEIVSVSQLIGTPGESADPAPVAPRTSPRGYAPR